MQQHGCADNGVLTVQLSIFAFGLVSVHLCMVLLVDQVWKGGEALGLLACLVRCM